MAAKPTPGGSDGTYGTEMNEFLDVSLASDGKIKDGAEQTTSTAPTTDVQLANKKYVDDTGGFVDRGDPSGNDIQESSSGFSSVGDVDGTWFEFDLNSIAGVPTTAKAVLVDLLVRDNVVGVEIDIRDSDQSNSNSRARIFTQVADVNNSGDFISPITDGKIDIRSIGQKFSDFTEIVLNVKGWWL